MFHTIFKNFVFVTRYIQFLNSLLENMESCKEKGSKSRMNILQLSVITYMELCLDLLLQMLTWSMTLQDICFYFCNVFTYCMGTNHHLASLKSVHLAVVRVNCRCAVTVDSMQVLLLSQRRKERFCIKKACCHLQQ